MTRSELVEWFNKSELELGRGLTIDKLLDAFMLLYQQRCQNTYGRSVESSYALIEMQDKVLRKLLEAK